MTLRSKSNSFWWFQFLCFHLVWTKTTTTTTTAFAFLTTTTTTTTTTQFSHFYSTQSHTSTPPSHSTLLFGSSGTRSLVRKPRFVNDNSMSMMQTPQQEQEQEQEDHHHSPSLPLLFTSLAGPFRVDIQIHNNNDNDEKKKNGVLVWSLMPIHQLHGITNDMPVGTQAMKAMASHALEDSSSIPLEPFITLQCQQQQQQQQDSDNYHLTVTATTPENHNDDDNDENTLHDYADIVNVLSRIMIQQYAHTFAIVENSNKNASYKITLPSFGNDSTTETTTTTTTVELDSLVHEQDIYKLFCGDEYDANDTSLELVEMVARQLHTNDNDTNHHHESSSSSSSSSHRHTVLGIVPRPLVHSHNLLHRGIGVVVTRGTPILLPAQQPQEKVKLPALYTHRRTSTKRIFPSLYDMFVGGVSGANEDSTCTVLRELQEELNLGNPHHLSSSALFDCTVCTSYNRCHVTVFEYTCSPEEESHIQWQKEEVAWGEFVPYDIIEKAASYSIQRFQQSKTWPGTYPDYDDRTKDSQSHGDDGVVAVVEQTKTPEHTTIEEDWKHWDFVPDGLLVWNAWVQWYNTKL